MNLIQFEYKNRREFIKTCLRFGIGSGLLFTGIALGLRKKGNNTENDLCQLNTPCRGCAKYKGCRLPRALNDEKGGIGESE